jgi:hypothetical protein
MRASEILRKLADVIDSADGSDAVQTAPQVAHPNVRVALAPAEQPSAEQPQIAVTTFVPPLQAKIELLKKAVDVDSIYDQGGDELGQMKKRAGINPAVTAEASEDNDITG